MAEDWGAVAADVSDALEEVGFTATLEKPGEQAGPEYDPVIGPPTEHPVTIVSGDFDFRHVDGTTIRVNDRKITMSTAGLPSPPTPADVLIINGRRLQIINPQPLDPGGVALLYECQVRG